MSTAPAPDTDAAMVLGMAATAMPFADSREAQAERWLRILRLYGESGTALQALGVSEGPLEGSPEAQAEAGFDPTENRAGDMIAAVSDSAAQLARERGAHTLGTSDVLVAVIQVYGADFDHVLRVHGTDRAEVLERLEHERSRPAGD
jgi:hypothetical protein